MIDPTENELELARAAAARWKRRYDRERDGRVIERYFWLAVAILFGAMGFWLGFMWRFW